MRRCFIKGDDFDQGAAREKPPSGDATVGPVQARSHQHRDATRAATSEQPLRAQPHGGARVGHEGVLSPNGDRRGVSVAHLGERRDGNHGLSFTRHRTATKGRYRNDHGTPSRSIDAMVCRGESSP